MHRDWNRSPPPYNPDHHSTKEIEHRFTSLEEFSEESKEDRSDIHRTLSKHSEKLTFHERVLLGLAITVGAILQDKFPAVASGLASILKAMMGGR
jgi:hypothetical protein